MMKDKKILIIMIVSFAIHIFLFYSNKNTYWNGGLLLNHSSLALNLVNKKLMNIDVQWCSEISKLQNRNNVIIEPEEFNKTYKSVGNSHPNYERNPGYGLLLAATWLIFGNHIYDYLRFIQIFLNIIFLIIIFKLIKRLTGNEYYSYTGTLAYAICFPVSFLASYPSEEIWGIWSVIVFIYLLVDQFSIKNVLIASLILGFGSYIHELPHVLSKYLCIPIGIWVFFKIGSSFGKKEKLIKAISSVLIIFFIPIIVLSPYIIRNYRTFDMYFETRFWGNHGDIEGLGEFDNSFAQLNDEVAFKMAEEKIEKKGLKIDRSNPRFFMVLDDEYHEYLSKHPGIIYFNAIKRIPQFLKHRQYYGLEVYNEFVQKTNNANLNGRIYNFKTFLKENPFSFSALFHIIKILIDNVLIMCIGTATFVWYVLKSKNIDYGLLLFIVFLLYAGALRFHVEAKYYFVSYLITYIYIFIVIFERIKMFLRKKWYNYCGDKCPNR